MMCSSVVFVVLLGLFSELNLRLGYVECIFSLYDCFSYFVVVVVSKHLLQCTQGDVVIESTDTGGLVVEVTDKLPLCIAR
ncbi:hypothetical protein BGZ57DRAFT_168756 [Hyaloscypha finlandica]|nr:hypothetical protein BGZ57DRAFT_168756 [Hyaloscypha finlandica]